MEKLILDPCCGSKMFWFDKHNPNVQFCDKRSEELVLCDGRTIVIDPDTVCDFTEMPFESETFYHVVFDPPHLDTIGLNSWMALKYGSLKGIDWKPMIKAGFEECWRVLKPYGTLVFKWNETDIPVSTILDLINKEPLYGHKSGKLNKTHWMCFMKIPQKEER